MATKHPTHKCPRCNVTLIKRKNPHGGGFFFGCTRFESVGCEVTWSEKRGWRNPHVALCRPSPTRSAGISKRVETIDAMLLFFGCTREEVEALVNRDGLQAAMALMG